MLPWLEAAPASQSVLRALADTVGSDWRAGLADEAQRSRNAFAQPLITGTALAAWAALQAVLDEPPAVVAGYSVGELPAYACAGVFSAPTAMSLAVQRAAWMDAAVADQDTGLLSVSGLSRQRVLQTQAALACAIDIGAQQAIYAGEAAALAVSAQSLAALGAVCKRLEVRVASHSHWMRGAADAFAAHLAGITFSRPTARLVLNATGTSTRDPATLRQALSTQLAATVQWAACMDAIAEQGVACVMEIGAGHTLAQMWQQRHPAIPARSIDAFRDAVGAARWLQKQGGAGQA